MSRSTCSFNFSLPIQFQTTGDIIKLNKKAKPVKAQRKPGQKSLQKGVKGKKNLAAISQAKGTANRQQLLNSRRGIAQKSKLTGLEMNKIAKQTIKNRNQKNKKKITIIKPINVTQKTKVMQKRNFASKGLKITFSATASTKPNRAKKNLVKNVSLQTPTQKRAQNLQQNRTNSRNQQFNQRRGITSNNNRKPVGRGTTVVVSHPSRQIRPKGERNGRLFRR